MQEEEDAVSSVRMKSSPISRITSNLFTRRRERRDKDGVKISK